MKLWLFVSIALLASVNRSSAQAPGASSQPGPSRPGVSCEEGQDVYIEAALQPLLPKLKPFLPDADLAQVTARIPSGPQSSATAQKYAEDLAAAARARRNLAATDKDEGKKKKLQETASILDEMATTLTTSASLNVLVVPAGGQPISVRLANPPTTRLRLSFDGASTGRHHELEWDPAVTTPLIQHVTLEADRWAIAASVEPVFLQQGDGSLVIATQFGGLASRGPDLVLVGRPTALVASGRLSLDSEARQVAMTGWPAPTLGFTCGPSARLPMDAVTFAPHVTARPGQQRSLGVAPEIVTQTLSILAEIAVSRAKRGAMEVVKERFVKPICEDPGITLATLGLDDRSAAPPAPAFPRTCRLLESLRLEDILSSGEPLLHALRDDARLTIVPAVIQRAAQGRPHVDRLLQAALQIVNRVVERGTFDGLEAQLLLDLLGNLDLLTDALPSIPAQSTIAGRLKPLLRDKKLRDALCPGAPNAQCVEGLLTTAKTPHEWVRLAEQLPAGLTADWKEQLEDAIDLPRQRELAKLVQHLHTALETPSSSHAPLCSSHADVAACIKSLLQDPESSARFFQKLREDAALRSSLERPLKALVESKGELAEVVRATCRVRLAVAVVKKCAGASCSSSRVSDLLERPEAYFEEDRELPASLCWDRGHYVTAPAQLAALQRMVIDGLELVQPVRDAEGRERAVAAIQLAFTALAHVSAGDARMDVVKELAVAIARQQYDAALSAVWRFVERELKQAEKELPPGLKKLTELTGAVAVYTSVYRSTKDEDPKAAREARKKSLESLIDAATDRKGRDRTWVLSLGSNIGGSITYTNVYDRDDSHLSMKPRGRELAFRAPMGIGLQLLPGTSPGAKRDWTPFGAHFGLNVIDLGYFVKADPEAETRWSSFIVPGVEVGLTVGTAQRSFNVTGHASFAPGLSDPAEPTRPVWRYGVSVGYYVPFFDLN